MTTSISSPNGLLPAGTGSPNHHTWQVPGPVYKRLHVAAEIHLSYRSKTWLTVTFELGRDEVRHYDL